MDFTAIALSVTLFAVALYALHLVIRSAVLSALRQNREESRNDAVIDSMVSEEPGPVTDPRD